ncbi:RhoGAP-domain-containing protein [Gymnopus androsaceus JB14]|uniref:RhoGAP-domain-containing protein n=1 Tax=Gymnopus androsaceus JB14 TaxID=1447944 RepID=A0A6A4HE25_9AGAR|nr:RhoGAP-domain-containing protein [Gymnopus androsaceus JB14]
MSEPSPSTPSSRPSTSEPPTNGPIPLFDVQLRFLNDSYLSFFTERKRIEENYVDSLSKLYRKIKSIDSFLDDRSDMSTARVAWSEIRENIEREAQARQAFLHTLTSDIIGPLTTLKDTQERTRKRIKEDLKVSTSTYNEYAESRYTKKFAEVEESKRAAAVVPPTSPIMPSSEYQGLSKAPARPTVTAPQPLRALDRRPSGSGQGGRNRSPSGNTAFSDLAQQGKKQLNTLMGFLDKSGTVKETLGGRENHALRTVRAKRELEEADKEYRKSVHWLETLRLRKTKILESGYNSLSMFVEECSVAVKDALQRYSDNMQATSTTQTQLSSHVRGVIEKISPEKDKNRFASNIPRSLASAIPEPILYQHGQVRLLDYATTKNLPEGEVPKIVRVCIAEIDKRGLDAEGIYRVSGRHAVVQTLQHEYEKDEAKFEFRLKDDVYAVASLMKLYFRELPEPVFRIPLQDRIQHTQDIAEHHSNNFALLRSKMRRLPAVHYATLKALLEHLSRVVANSEKNKMDPKNLAIVFGGVIFGEDEIKGDLMSVQTMNDTLMEDLIINAQVLFSDEPNTHPLPAPPPGEPTPVYPYGSKTTKIVSIPSPLNSAAFQNAVLSPSEDFSPKLPPRPANSIHPSARGTSSTDLRSTGLPYIGESESGELVNAVQESLASPLSPQS